MAQFRIAIVVEVPDDLFAQAAMLDQIKPALDTFMTAVPSGSLTTKVVKDRAPRGASQSNGSTT